MRGDYFFEIPIYSMSEEDYYKRTENALQKEIKKYNLTKDNPNYEDVTDILKRQICREWEFNQIIGYLKLYRLNSKIYADFWKIDKKRMILKLDNKVFRYQCSSPDWDIDLEKLTTSKSIFEKLMKELPNDRKKLYKKYYIDLSILKEVGPHINWIELLDK